MPAGLPAEDGPSGIREDAPAPEGDVQGTDGGDADKLATLAVNDVAEFWEKNYAESFDGSFKAVQDLVSYNSESPSSPEICGGETYGNPNALFCPPDHLIAWDRGVLVPIGQQFFGDTSIAALLAHEYGHAVQDMAKLIDDDTSHAWSASSRRTASRARTSGGWPRASRPVSSSAPATASITFSAGVLTLRDPTYAAGDAPYLEQGHGTALDRISAFQIGFTSGASECGKIDMDEITARRGDLPLTLPSDGAGDSSSGNVEVTEDVVTELVKVLDEVFKPKDPPKVSFDAPECSDAKPSPPASYCPDSNTIFVDISALAEMGKPADREDYTLLQGDNSALSVVTSRYALAVQHERRRTAGLRGGCLAHRVPDGRRAGRHVGGQEHGPGADGGRPRRSRGGTADQRTGGKQRQRRDRARRVHPDRGVPVGPRRRDGSLLRTLQVGARSVNRPLTARVNGYHGASSVDDTMSAKGVRNPWL